VDKEMIEKIEAENDVVYIEPQLNLWWRIKMLFGDFFHPQGYIIKEDTTQNEKEQLQDGTKTSQEVHHQSG